MDKREHISYDNRLMRNGDETIDYKRGLEMAKEIGAITYLECLARLQEGFEDLYYEICRAVMVKNKRCVKIKHKIIVTNFMMNNKYK